MTRKLALILLNPIFQALVIAVLIIVLIPAGIEKYRCEQADMFSSFDQSQFIFADLDHDGLSERIHTFLNLSGNSGIVLKKGIHTIGQWNFKGVYEKNSPRFMLGDYNDDGSDEIFIFTKVLDSIILNVLNYSVKPDIIIKNRFITKLGRNLQDPDYLFIPGAVTDMNGDRSDDLVFAINAGHSRQPRNVFIYNILDDSLYHSPESGAFISSMKMQNIDQDPYPEILLSTYAASNYNKDPVIYSDTCSWFMVLDHDLKFLFKPLEFRGPSGGINCQTIQKADGSLYFIAGASYGYPLPDTSSLFLADLQGRILKKIDAKSGLDTEFPGLYPLPLGFSPYSILGMKSSKGFFSIDTNLNLTKLYSIELAWQKPDFVDIDQDHKDELILLKPDQQKHLILRNDFSHPAELNLPVQSTNPIYSIKLNGNDPPQLSVQGDQVWKLFDYGINPYWRFRLLFYLAIYLLILSFIMLIRKLYSLQLQKRYETEKKITTLQLSSVKAQMEPHFIMNTINTIGSSIYRQKPDEAYRLLLNFSEMVRSLLVSSDKLTRTLKEELDFVRNYLDLEKNRFSDVFDYSISGEDNADPQAIVPKMIIQLHAENALKHGLLPKKSGGLLEIFIISDNANIKIIIKDNGIGRSAASKDFSSSTGKGMKIIGQLFETYNKHNKNQLRQEIVDLFDKEGNPSGTEVRIFVPKDFNEGIF